ncbi:hypothetical protein LCGC14_2366580, partial [marine sediment metagenome]
EENTDRDGNLGFSFGVSDDLNQIIAEALTSTPWMMSLGVTFSTSPGSVTTQAVTAIAAETATGNGNVISLGGPSATQHGHCWSISPNPTVSDSKTTKGAPGSTGAYTSSLTSLLPKTKYYVKSYIQGSWGTIYGAEVEFTTLGDEPSVSIQATSSIDATTATGNGNVTALGSPVASQYGHCWDTAQSPTKDDSGSGFWGKTSKGIPGATGAYTSDLTGLSPNTLYYMRSYITNTLGTFYSQQQASFTTSVGVPELSTDEADEVTETSALGKGTLINDGGSSVTEHGVVWDTSADPTIALSTRTEEGAATVGDFTSLMFALAANTLYHYRTYATNSSGTGYGEDKTFSTNITGAPTVTSEDPTDLQETTVTGNGTIVGIGGSSVTEHGHCWSTSPNPTTADSKTTNGAASAGAFTSAITDLVQNTRYYYRAYATNTQGTGYGNNVTFVMGFAFPVDTVSRVSGIKRTFWAGAAGSPGVYLAELFLGGLSTTYISSIGDREPVPSVPSTQAPSQLARTPVSGQGFQLSDYARWLSENTAFNIIRIFGHRP